MKFVVVPVDVIVVDKKGKPILLKRSETEDDMIPFVIKHEDFVFDHITGHEMFTKGGGQGARRQRRVRKLFEDCKPGDVIPVEEADFALVKPILEGLTWSAAFAKYAEQMLPHIEAWENAEKQDADWKKKLDEDKAAALAARTNGASQESPAV